MESSCAEKIPSSFHPIHHHQYDGGQRHHRHFYYVSPHCPLHRPMLQPNNHSPSCSFSTAPQNLEPIASIPPNPNLGFLDMQPSGTFVDFPVMQDEIEKLEDEEEGEPIFVLTDEWRDFFAKSDAKRKLAKKQAKKGKKTLDGH